jgi:hypothetical protein
LSHPLNPVLLRNPPNPALLRHPPNPALLRHQPVASSFVDMNLKMIFNLIN